MVVIYSVVCIENGSGNENVFFKFKFYLNMFSFE